MGDGLRSRSAWKLVFIFLLSMGISSGFSSPARSDDSKVDIKTTAPAMFEAYDENEVAADENFKGKVIEVSGTVESIGKDIMGSPYIALEGGGLVMVVQCYLADDAISAAASVHKGQRLVLVGKFDSKFGNILLKGCVIKK